MALTGSEDVSRLPARSPLAEAWARLKARLGDAEHQLVQRLAGTVFLIRVASAALAFGSQVLLARWMGSFEFGIYVYVWTWVLLLGQAIDLGLGTAAQRFVPEYRERGTLALLRGFVSGSRWLAFGIAILLSGLCAGAACGCSSRSSTTTCSIPLYLACVTVPAYALGNVQEGIARSYDWVGLSMMPGYIARQLLLTVLMAIAYVRHLPMNAVTAMVVAAISIWLPTLAQFLIVNRRLAQAHRAGPKAYDFRVGYDCTADPDGRRLLLDAGLYRCARAAAFRPPDEVAVYYAPPRRSRSSPSSTIRVGPPPRTGSAAITSPATTRRFAPSGGIDQVDLLAVASPQPLCCCFSAGRSWPCSAPSSPTAIT